MPRSDYSHEAVRCQHAGKGFLPAATKQCPVSVSWRPSLRRSRSSTARIDPVRRADSYNARIHDHCWSGGRASKALACLVFLFLFILYVESVVLQDSELVCPHVSDDAIFLHDNRKDVVAESSTITDIHQPAIADVCLDGNRVSEFVYHLIWLIRLVWLS